MSFQRDGNPKNGGSRGEGSVVLDDFEEAEGDISCKRRSCTIIASSRANTDPQPLEEPTTVVEFLIHKSLPDKNPTIVKRERDLYWSFMLFDPNIRGAQSNLGYERNYVEL